MPLLEGPRVTITPRYIRVGSKAKFRTYGLVAGGIMLGKKIILAVGKHDVGKLVHERLYLQLR